MTRLALPAAALFALTACTEFFEFFDPPDPVPVSEAMDGMQSVFLSERALAPTTGLIESAPVFRLGDPVPTAMDDLVAWVEAEIPCAGVWTSDGNTVWVDFGALGDGCAWQGAFDAGQWSVLFDDEITEEARAIHRWDAATDGTRSLDGIAMAWWDADDGERNVDHDLEWVELGTTVGSTGRRVQSLVEPDLGLAGGVAIEGDRNWTVRDGVLDGSWLLDMEGVEVRGVDAVPQAGSCVLQNPDGRTITMTFEAIDDATALVKFTDYKQPYAFRVDRATGERVDLDEGF